MAVGDEYVAAGRHDDVARRRQVIRTAARLPRRAQRHQHLAVGTELDDHLSALVALRRPVLGDGIGNPDVAAPIDVETVRPDEHAAAEAPDHLAVGAELEYRIALRVAALV